MDAQFIKVQSKSLMYETHNYCNRVDALMGEMHIKETANKINCICSSAVECSQVQGTASHMETAIAWWDVLLAVTDRYGETRK